MFRFTRIGEQRHIRLFTSLRELARIGLLSFVTDHGDVHA